MKYRPRSIQGEGRKAALSLHMRQVFPVYQILIARL